MNQKIVSSGWKKDQRTLPDGTIFRRNPKAHYVVQYEALFSGKERRAGKILNIFPSELAASAATGCSVGGIHNCCTHWMSLELSLIPGMEKEARRYESLYSPHVARSGQRTFIFKWLKFKDRRYNPVVVILDEHQRFFYESLTDAARDLAGTLDNELTYSRLAHAALASPMYVHGEIIDCNPWPTVMTRLGWVNVFYI